MLKKIILTAITSIFLTVTSALAYQAPLQVPNGTAAQVRINMNAALLTLGTANAGPLPPSPSYAGELWLNTSTNPAVMEIRDITNSIWSPFSSTVTLTILASNLNANGHQITNLGTATVTGEALSFNQSTLNSLAPPTANYNLNGHKLTNAGADTTTGDVLSNGQSPLNSLALPTANYNLNSFKLTNSGSDSTNGDVLSRGQSTLNSLAHPTSNYSMAGTTLTNVATPLAAGEPEVEGRPIGGTSPSTIVGTSLQITGQTNGCIQADSSGNFISTGLGCGGPNEIFPVDTTTGVINGKLAKLISEGMAFHQSSYAIVTSVGDTYGAVGFVSSPTATSGNATITTNGVVVIQSDTAFASGQYAIQSTANAGNVISTGNSVCPANGQQVIGTFTSSNTSALAASVLLGNPCPNTENFVAVGNNASINFTVANPIISGVSVNGVTNVDAYGAVGNGVTDDSAAIENCLNANGNNICELTPGKVYAVSQLTIPGNDKTLRSENSYSAQILVTGNGGGTCNPNTTLNGSITLPVSSILVVSTTGFPSTGTVVVGPTPSKVLTYTSKDATHFYFSSGSGGTGTISTGAYAYSPTNGGIISTGNYNTLENLVLATNNSSLDCILNTTAPDYNLGENSNLTLKNIGWLTVGLSASTSNPTAWTIANLTNVNLEGMNSAVGNFKHIIYHDPTAGVPAGNSNAGVLYGFKINGTLMVPPLSSFITGGVYNDGNYAIELGNANDTTINGLWCDGTLNCLHMYPSLDGGASILNPFAISNTIACQAWLPATIYNSNGCVIPSAVDQCNFTASSTNFSCVGNNHATGQIIWGIGAGVAGGTYQGQITFWNPTSNTGTFATAPSTSISTANDAYINAYNGHIYRDTGSFTSGSSQPTFPTSVRATVADSTGEWIEYGPGAWLTLEGAGISVAGGYFNAAPAVGIYLTNNTRGFHLSGAGMYAQPVAGVFCNGCNGAAIMGNGWAGTGVFNLPLVQTSSAAGNVSGIAIAGNQNSSTGAHTPVYADANTSGYDFDDMPYFGGPGASNWTTLAMASLGIKTFNLSGSANFTGIQVDTTNNTIGAISKVFCNSSSALTETLPAATGSGRELVIKNINTGACTVDSGSGKLIDGNRTYILSTQFQSITIFDEAANQWYIE